MPYKATLFFNARNQGWTESWYMNGGSLTAVHTLVGSIIVQLRIPLLGVGCTLEAYRTVDLTSPGAALFSLVAGGKPPNPLPDNRDNASNAILVRLETNDPYRRNMWLRGVPDNWIGFTAGQTPVVTPGLANRINLFALTMGVAGVGLHVISNLAATNPPIRITGLGVDASNNVVVKTAAPTAYAVGQYVRINGVRGNNLKPVPPAIKGLNGIWQVIPNKVVDANTFTIPLSFADLPGTPQWYGGGFARSRWYADQPGPPPTAAQPFPIITRGSIVRFARKKVGRALFTPAGRQRAVRRM